MQSGKLQAPLSVLRNFPICQPPRNYSEFPGPPAAGNDFPLGKAGGRYRFIDRETAPQAVDPTCAARPSARAHLPQRVAIQKIQYVLGQTLTADLASLDCAASKTKSLAIDCLGQVPLTLSIFYGSLGTECRTLLVQRLRSCPGSRTK